MKVVHQNLFLLFGGNVEDSENEESRQDVIWPSDYIQTVSDDGELEIAVVLTDPEHVGEGDAILLQYMQTVYELNYWVNTIWGWVKYPFWHQ